MTNFLSQLFPTTTKSKKRRGQGIGSGKGGHTVGRGQKGQKTRSKIPLLFTGTKNKKSLVQRLPKLRGKGKMKSLQSSPLVINLEDLNQLKPHTQVNIDTLIAARLVTAKEIKGRSVKILNQGHLTHPLIINLPISQSARAQIEAAGGQVIH